MYLKPQHTVSTVFALTLVSCVSVNEKVQLVSAVDSTDADTELIASIETRAERTNSCQLKPQTGKSSRSLKTLNPDNISLLNWNIYKGNKDGWQEDLSTFSKKHDLMTIQEATLDEQFLDILEGNDLSWTMNAAFHFNGTTAGVMNVSNADAIYNCGFKTSEPIIRIPKSTLISYYIIDGRVEQLLVANIHGINFTLGMDSYNEQLSRLYDAISQHEGPMILAGDFNNWSDERVDEVDRIVTKLSLSKLEYPINNKTHVFGNAIDHVFFRRLELVSNQVMQVSSSDHNAISVSFKLQ